MNDETVLNQEFKFEFDLLSANKYLEYGSCDNMLSVGCDKFNSRRWDLTFLKLALHHKMNSTSVYWAGTWKEEGEEIKVFEIDWSDIATLSFCATQYLKWIIR